MISKYMLSSMKLYHVWIKAAISNSCLFIAFMVTITCHANNQQPVKMAIVGLSHGHAQHAIRLLNSPKVNLVAVVESDKHLRALFQQRFGIKPNILYPSLSAMLKQVTPEAVAVFSQTDQHFDIVKQLAPLGIHIMVEKPLAIDAIQAQTMAELAQDNNVHLLTNYETRWHPSIQALKSTLAKGEIGHINRLVFHHGNKGMQLTNNELDNTFFRWLTDPVANGGGALMDFACYGLNILNWLTEGEMPVSTYAQFNQYKPELYPDVEDDAVLLLNYKNFQAILMASWNWPIPRKDLQIYGRTGQIDIPNSHELTWQVSAHKPKGLLTWPKTGYPINEPFEFLADLIRKKVALDEYDLLSIENNLLVMQQLDIAKQSNRATKPITIIQKVN